MTIAIKNDRYQFCTSNPPLPPQVLKRNAPSLENETDRKHLVPVGNLHSHTARFTMSNIITELFTEVGVNTPVVGVC